jgi:hypothetical protein
MTSSRVPIALTVAARQHGVISLRQLAMLEVSRSQLRTAIKRHLLVEAAPRVYSVVGSPDTLEQRQQVALLCLGSDAVLSHEAAARLHGFDRCRPDVIELTVLRRHHGVRAPFRIHTTNSLPTIDRVMVDEWPVTSASRTVIDLARSRVSEDRLTAAIDSAIRSGASSPLALSRRLEALRGPGHWGVPRLDHLLIDAGGHTILERRFLELMRQAGPPRPTTQLIHRRNGRTYTRLASVIAVRPRIGEPFDQFADEALNDARQTRRPRARLITRRCTSLVPSPISRILASR